MLVAFFRIYLCVSVVLPAQKYTLNKLHCTRKSRSFSARFPLSSTSTVLIKWKMLGIVEYIHAHLIFYMGSMVKVIELHFTKKIQVNFFLTLPPIVPIDSKIFFFYIKSRTPKQYLLMRDFNKIYIRASETFKVLKNGM